MGDTCYGRCTRPRMAPLSSPWTLPGCTGGELRRPRQIDHVHGHVTGHVHVLGHGHVIDHVHDHVHVHDHDLAPSWRGCGRRASRRARCRHVAVIVVVIVNVADHVAVAEHVNVADHVAVGVIDLAWPP
jgi:hypothetical protein